MIEGAVMWTSLETAELMGLWRRTETQQLFRSSGRNLAIWERLAEELLERGFYRTAHQCRAKLHNMVCLYRKVERGELPRTRCRHYDTLRGVLSAGSPDELERFNAPWEERCRRERLLREQERSQLSRLPAERRDDRPAGNQANASMPLLSLSQTQLSPLQTRLSPQEIQLSPREIQLSPRESHPEQPQLSPDTAGARSAASPRGSGARRPPPTLVALASKKPTRRRLPELLPLSALSVSSRVLPTGSQDSPASHPDDDRLREASYPRGDTSRAVDSARLDSPADDLSMKSAEMRAAKRKAVDEAPLAKKVPGSAFVRVIPEHILRSRVAAPDTTQHEERAEAALKTSPHWKLHRPGYTEEARDRRLISALAYMRANALNLSVTCTELGAGAGEATAVPALRDDSVDSRLTPADSRLSASRESAGVDSVRGNGRLSGGDSVPRSAARSPAVSDDTPLSLVTARSPPSPPTRLIIRNPQPRSPPSSHRLIVGGDADSSSSPSPPPPLRALSQTASLSPGSDHAAFSSHLQGFPSRCGTPPPAHRQSVGNNRQRSRASTSPSPPRVIEAGPPPAQHGPGLTGLAELQRRCLLGLRSPPSPLKRRAKSGWSPAWHPGAAQSAATWRRVRQLLSDAAGAQMAAYEFLGGGTRSAHDAL